MNILIVSHGIINNYTGLGRVHLELMEEYKKAGHHVEKVDYADLFPKGQNKFQRIFESSFTEKLFKYLQKHASKYNVIDANFENVPFSKSSFNFQGLVFIRSHGIRPLSMAAEKIEVYTKALEVEGSKKRTIRNVIGSYIRSFYKDLTLEDFNNTLKYADIVHCLNTCEYDYFVKQGIDKSRLIFIPNGLPEAFLRSLYLHPQIRQNNPNEVSFISSWRLLKGVKDWRQIANKLIDDNTITQINIIGSGLTPEMVKQDFDPNIFSRLNIIPFFIPEKLPELLRNSRVGIFSSYMEGFGFAVLEQLAAGIPVIAYNVPGVSDMLSQIDPSLLVTPGDIEQLTSTVKTVLALNSSDYQELSQKCIQVSKNYILENLALKYLEVFEKNYSN